jgi:acetyltransferase-like isoleucine patch superfamily enzyme
VPNRDWKWDLIKLSLSMEKSAARSNTINGVIHETAIIEESVSIGDHTHIWHFCHVRKNAIIGSNVSLARDVFIDEAVKISSYSRIQNGVSIYRGVQISEWVFVGPHVIFTNDMNPRVGKRNWKIVETHMMPACSIGAGAIIRCGVTLGAFSMIGAGSVVTRNIPAFTLAVGSPARPIKKICACGEARFALNAVLDSPFCLNCHINLAPELKDLASAEFASLQVGSSKDAN